MTLQSTPKKPADRRKNPAKRRTVKRDQALQRRGKAWQLRVEQGLSYREIADHLGVSVAVAFDDLEAGRDEVREQHKGFAEDERVFQFNKLRGIGKKILEKFEATEDSFELVPLSRAYVKVTERIGKLLGLDAPLLTKNEHTGPDGGPLLTAGEDWQARLVVLGWTPPKNMQKEILPGLPMPGEPDPEDDGIIVQRIEVDE